ncbi:MAG: hypoxanthine phosphoribosyltransferase [Bacteroidales bacterium]|nr:hypoxanthine phosphoribosyltransferase [Candidatus Colimorpha onthohippi]
MIKVLDKSFRCYLSAADIAQIVERLAAEISRDLKDLNPIICPVLNGSFMFATDLLRSLDFDPEISFVKFQSYQGTQSSATVKELVGFPESVTGRNVLIIEDIVETGHTMRQALSQLAKLHPASVRICAMVRKPQLLQADVKVDYVGKDIDNEFIVGYGLDYNGYGRTYPDIYQLVEP